jgi:uncharacterized protein YqgC (DUF456 family)
MEYMIGIIIGWFIVGIIIGWFIGWLVAHSVIATECRRFGQFYVGKKVYKCTEIVWGEE